MRCRARAALAAGVVLVLCGSAGPVAASPSIPSPSASTTNLALHHAVDLQIPIGCAEVAVYPGDIMVGDEDGVVCIPRELAADVADAAVEQERLELFITAEIDRGAALPGTYPPGDDLLARYRASREA